MSTLTESLREAAADAMEGYRALVADCAEGVEVTPEEAIQIAKAAGRTAQQLANDIELASRRAEANAKYQGRDFDGEISAVTEEYKAMPAMVEAATVELEAAREKLRSLTQRQSQLLTVRSTLERDKKAAHDAYTQLMQSTSQETRDPGHPTNFKLS